VDIEKRGDRATATSADSLLVRAGSGGLNGERVSWHGRRR